MGEAHLQLDKPEDAMKAYKAGTDPLILKAS
jgi:hypothetical protein